MEECYSMGVFYVFKLYKCYQIAQNIHEGVLLLVTPPWVFFTFFKLYNSYQIAQNITYKPVNFDSVSPILLSLL